MPLKYKKDCWIEAYANNFLSFHDQHISHLYEAMLSELKTEVSCEDCGSPHQPPVYSHFAENMNEIQNVHHALRRQSGESYIHARFPQLLQDPTQPLHKSVKQ